MPFRFPAAMKTATQLFKGANVFMSRNLVPPEVFDALLDTFKLNGAEIFLCCDPSRNGPSDFHVIASPQHEKFEDLKAKGCNLIGPQCVLSCAKEGRPLPQGGFTCCLAMDGLKVLASGFLIDEKVKIEKLVTSMGGVLVSRTSSDVNFVIVKNVLAAKYKWALYVQKKPVVALSWLHQCWNEHRVVPQEPYKIPSFSGLRICVTKIPADQRKGMEKLISENGGRYSAELTKACTHLIADAAEGDKYKVARKWGHIQIVTRKWFEQSIARKVCLNEELYPVLGSISSSRGVRGLGNHDNQEKFPECPVSLSHSTAVAEDSYASYAQSRESDIEPCASQNRLSTSMNPSSHVKEPSKDPTTEPQEQNIDGCTARDSVTEDNDLYLSDCKIFLLGFEASEMRRLVKLVRRGGGSRYMMLSERMTHIVVGTPSESEKKEARSVAASGVVHVVTPNWLEDCDREKKEIPIHKIYTAHNLILPRDSECLTKGSRAGMPGMEKGKTTFPQTVAYDSPSRSISISDEAATLLGKNKEAVLDFGRKDEIHVERKIVSPKKKETLSSAATIKSKEQKIQCEFSGQSKQERKSTVFKGKIFCFSDSFPQDQRPEIVEWVNQGGGEVVNDSFMKNTDFTIECHGMFRSAAGTTQTTYVSSHWVRSCLEDGCLLDVSSHILYSPLPCQTPLPGFESLRFCVSHYEEKDRLLLRNLCFVLGAKFVSRQTKKVTHLLCKFAHGPKYDAASKWGIVPVTSDWVYECVKQNQVVCPDNYHPKEMNTQDRDAGVGLASQFHTQSVPVASRENESLHGSHSEDRVKSQSFAGKNGCGKSEVNNRLGEIGREQSFPSKKAKLLRDGRENDAFPMDESPSKFARPLKSGDGIGFGNDVASGRVVPDVADTIEDLLEQTSRIQDQNSPGSGRISEKNLFSASEQYSSGNHSVTGLSRHWINRVQENDDAGNPRGDVTPGTYGNFSETQTESQVIGYEEDLSGRQMLIDRVRTRSRA